MGLHRQQKQMNKISRSPNLGPVDNFLPTSLGYTYNSLYTFYPPSIIRSVTECHGITCVLEVINTHGSSWSMCLICINQHTQRKTNNVARSGMPGLPGLPLKNHCDDQHDPKLFPKIGPPSSKFGHRTSVYRGSHLFARQDTMLYHRAPADEKA